VREALQLLRKPFRPARHNHNESSRLHHTFEPDLRVLQDTLRGHPRPEEVVEAGLAARAARIADGIRGLSRGIHPPVLVDHGLTAAIRAMLRRLDVDVALDVDASVGDTRFPAPVETTVYLCCQAAVHAAAGARSVAVRLWREDDALAFAVSHDTYCDDDALAGVRDRVATLGGEIVTRNRVGRSAVTGRVPAAG
jgi:glucose-6-phosphate-specific signal transduction histidine kinase